MNIKGKNFLITGASGFIGANLTRHFLKKGANISILKRRQSNLWRVYDIKNRISIYNADLLDYAKVNRVVNRIKPDVIFHTAAYGGHVSQDNLSRILKTNFIGTVNLLNSCSKTGFELFVNTGSSSEYGIKDHPMKESDILTPITPYGVSKAAATIYCQYVAKRNDLPIITLRLFSPYGYFDDGNRVISYVILSCLKNSLLNISSPDSVRDFIFIDDVMLSYEQALEKNGNMRGDIFNIGSGKQCSIINLAKKIIRAFGNNMTVGYKEDLCAGIEPKHWVADTSKSFKELGWKPKFNLDEGLKKTIKWFKDNNSFYS
jgi:nucleoside-diphosphate-sugar epimerase